MWFIPIFLALGVGGLILICIRVADQREFRVEYILMIVFIPVALYFVYFIGKRVIMVSNIAFIPLAIFFVVESISYLVRVARKQRNT